MKILILLSAVLALGPFFQRSEGAEFPEIHIYTFLTALFQGQHVYWFDWIDFLMHALPIILCLFWYSRSKISA